MTGWIKRNLERFGTFCRNHKVEIIAALIGTAVVGTGVVICRNADKALSAEGQDIINKLEKGLSSDKGMNWSEDYRENWNKVNAFADDLVLAPRESYWLEEASGYEHSENFAVNKNNIVVSHMIDYDGAYPPEEN